MTTSFEPIAEPDLDEARVLPRAAERGGGVAPIRDGLVQWLHPGLFLVGAVLLPLGLIVIGLGWYGVANTALQYQQITFLMSGGFLGLGITFVGGFLYFGAWLARVAADQRESQRQLADGLKALAESIEQLGAAPPTFATGGARAAAPAARPRDAGAALVLAGAGTTVHRADCALVSDRTDLHPVGTAEAGGLPGCRVCQPT